MSDDSEQINQDDIEALLQQATGGGSSDPEPIPQSEPSSDASGGANGDLMLGLDEIEALMSGEASAPPAQAPQAGFPPPGTFSAPAPQAPIGAPPAQQSDMEYLLDQAQQAISSIDGEHRALPEGVEPFRLDDFNGTPANHESATLELVRDVQLDLKIELGRTMMSLEDVLRLRRDAVVTLDKLAGDPVDVYANGRLIARGEVLVLNDNFCVRVTELIVGDSAVA